MAIWKFKSCPRCGGDIFIGRDLDSWYEQCLQCGYLGDLSWFQGGIALHTRDSSAAQKIGEEKFYRQLTRPPKICPH